MDIPILVHWDEAWLEEEMPVWFQACLAEYRQTGRQVVMPLSATLLSNRELTPEEMKHAQEVIAQHPGWRRSGPRRVCDHD